MSDKITNRRTRRTPNEIIVYDDYAEVILYNRHNEENGRAIIDIEDIEKVSKYKWGTAKSGYVRNVKYSLSLHQLIIGFMPEKPNVIDHINRNRYDNRRSNLRIVDFSINGFNKGKQSNNTSGYVGVYWDKNRNKWEASIKIDRKKRFLGYYNTIEEAIERRKMSEIELFGELRNEEHDVNTVFK